MTDPKALIAEARVIADAYDAKKWEAGEFMPQGIIRRLADALEEAIEPGPCGLSAMGDAQKAPPPD